MGSFGGRAQVGPRRRVGWLAATALAAVGCASSEPPAADPPCTVEQRRFSGVLIAGSGSALPFARHLLAADSGDDRARRYWVADSIGTSGGVAALVDGAIDVALATRPLRDPHPDRALRSRPFARAPLALVVDPDVPVDGMTLDAVEALYRGRPPQWPDGSPVRLLVREPGDSGDEAIRRVHPGLYDAMDEARRHGRAVELHTDADMRDALLALDGAIGFLDAGAVRLDRLPLRMLAIDGAHPTAEDTAAGRYPLVRTFTMLWRADAPAATLAVVDTLAGPAAARLRATAGYATATPAASPERGAHE